MSGSFRGDKVYPTTSAKVVLRCGMWYSLGVFAGTCWGLNSAPTYDLKFQVPNNIDGDVMVQPVVKQNAAPSCTVYVWLSETPCQNEVVVDGIGFP